MTLHLIRHGKTRANEERLYCGFTNLPLCENGLRELKELKHQIAYPKAELCFASGLLRTVQTANLLFENPVIIEIPELQEINFGEFEMRGHEELKTVFSYQSWISNIEVKPPPGGESKPDFTKRVIEGFFKAANLCMQQGAGHAAIITHGGVIAAIMEHFYPGQKNFYEWQPACGRGYTLLFQNNQAIEYTRLQEEDK